MASIRKHLDGILYWPLLFTFEVNTFKKKHRNVIIPTYFDLITDKRNSTGNLYFEGGNSQDPGGLSGLTNSLQQGSARILRGLSGSQPVGMRDSTSSLSSMNSDYDPNDPQAMFSRELRTAAGTK